MSRLLPLFPLQLVAFPGEQLKLHIFEPRYRQLISECRDEGITFGIPAYLKGGLAQYGTEMCLVEVFTTYESGEMDVMCEGVAAFELKRFVKTMPGKLYSGGEVVTIVNDEHVDEDHGEEIWELYRKLHEVLKTGHERERPDGPNISFVIAHEIGLSVNQRLQLLSMAREAERQQFIVEHLRQVLPMLEATEETKKRIRANGHFKKLPKIEL